MIEILDIDWFDTEELNPDFNKGADALVKYYADLNKVQSKDVYGKSLPRHKDGGKPFFRTGKLSNSFVKMVNGESTEIANEAPYSYELTNRAPYFTITPSLLSLFLETAYGT